MKYGSVCSGIEAASVAWKSLGWKASWFSEIEAFPSAVLAQRWPEVANLGDMTKIAEAVRAGEVEAPDVLVGGTPCQAFSVAGLRNGLSDARGQLTLSYVELADAIDDKRHERGEEETIFVWENVPGVLSSKDNAFGCFIGALAGESCELQPAGGKWPNAGCVYGPSRIVAWRVLDAQFFGVAQRRRRVFVVASARDGFDPAKVLFELDSVRRDTPPRRDTGKEIATVAGKRAESGSHWDNPGNPHPTLNQTNNIGGIGSSNQEIFSQHGSGLVSDIVGALAAHSFTGGAGGRPEGAATGHFIPIFTMAHGQGGAEIKADGTVPTLTCNHEAPITAHSVSLRGREGGATAELGDDRAGTLRASTGGGDKAHALVDAKVRRLTPRECERLQGFQDDHTLISWRGKEAADCPDGPRYRAIGNSMAVPVMRWIGERIQKEINAVQNNEASSGKYKLIYVDPPWQYGNTVSNGAAGNLYSTMSIMDLKRLPVWDLADENAVLAMWYTGTHNEEARALAEAWGFTVRTMKGFTWVKLNQRAEQRINAALAEGQVCDFYDFLDLLNAESRMNGGNHTRANTEDVLIATRGTGIERASASVKQVVYSCLGEHSEKPWEVRNRLEKLYGDVPRIELFARSTAEGWDIWGNECDSSVRLLMGRVA